MSKLCQGLGQSSDVSELWQGLGLSFTESKLCQGLGLSFSESKHCQGTRPRRNLRAKIGQMSRDSLCPPGALILWGGQGSMLTAGQRGVAQRWPNF